MSLKFLNLSNENYDRNHYSPLIDIGAFAHHTFNDSLKIRRKNMN